MPNWSKIKNTVSGWVNGLSPNRFKLPFGITKAPPSTLRQSFNNLFNEGKNFLNDAIESGIANFRPTNIRDAWLQGPKAALEELKNTTFNPKAWKKDALGTLGTTAINTVFPSLSLYWLLQNDPHDDLEGTVEHYTKKFFQATDVVDPFNKFFFRDGNGKPVGGLGGFLGGMFFNPRLEIMPRVTRKIDEWLGTSVSREELQKRFMKRLNTDANKLLEKNVGLDKGMAYEQAARNILAYEPDYYNKLVRGI